MEMDIVPYEVTELIESLKAKVYIIEEQMTSRKEYLGWVEEVYDYIKIGFEHKELRRCMISFKFRSDDDEVHQLSLPNFITNIMIWEGILRLDMIPTMNKSIIYDANNTTSSTLYGFFNEKLIIPSTNIISNKKLNKVMHDITHNLSRISTDFNMLLGISISMNSFINLSKTNERFNEIINTKVPEDMQPADIENHLDTLMHELTDIMTTSDNCLKPMMLAQTGVKDKQLREFAINGGTKPDLFGNTIPIPINSNFLVGGLGNTENYTIDAMGGRKAAIMSKTMMGISGHFATTVILASSSVTFSKEGDDCGSIFPIPMYIRDVKMLQRFVGRFYRENINSMELKCIRKSDMQLVGRMIYLRTPTTCAASDGVCKTCYGHLYHINKDLASPGAFSAIKVTMPVSQDILSSKHLLATTSIKIEFNEEFYKFFKVSSNYVILDDNDDININNYSLVIKDEDLQLVSEFDENLYNHFVQKFYISKKGSEDLIEIVELNENDLYIDKDIFKSMKKKSSHREIQLNKIETDNIFVIEIKNNELTKPLYDIMNLLDIKKSEHRGDIQTMLTRMNELMIQSRINLQSIHAEMIIYSLIRKTDNILERPDFNSYDGRNYTILTIKDSLENHASPIIGISFQYLKRQLTKRPLTYSKAAVSVLDPLFKER